ncbi:MAG: TonB-dependent receptor [Terricaulis sp.]|nr:TonB-dependent receptor [Terricaulis sp.]
MSRGPDRGEAPRGDRWSGPTANNFRAPWARLDAKVVLDLDDAWRATFSGANLTDTAYQTNRSTQPALVGSGPGYELYGREYRLSLTRRW